MGILIHDEDDFSSLILNHCAGCDDGDVSESVAVDALHVHNLVDSVNDAGVGPTYTTAASSVDECSPVFDLVIGRPISDAFIMLQARYLTPSITISFFSGAFLASDDDRTREMSPGGRLDVAGLTICDHVA
jgi:hypothetical protein